MGIAIPPAVEGYTAIRARQAINSFAPAGAAGTGARRVMVCADAHHRAGSRRFQWMPSPSRRGSRRASSAFVTQADELESVFNDKAAITASHQTASRRSPA
jgi:hypothetical protein